MSSTYKQLNTVIGISSSYLLIFYEGEQMFRILSFLSKKYTSKIRCSVTSMCISVKKAFLSSMFYTFVNKRCDTMSEMHRYDNQNKEIVFGRYDSMRSFYLKTFRNNYETFARHQRHVPTLFCIFVFVIIFQDCACCRLI